MPKAKRNDLYAHERADDRRTQRALNFLVRIRDELDPQEFTREELEAEFEIHAAKPLVKPPEYQRLEVSDLDILVRLGYVEEFAPETYRVTESGHMLEVDEDEID